MSSTRESKSTTHDQDLKIIAAVDKYFASATQMAIAGTTYTPATLKAVFQAEIDANNAADSTRAVYRQQIVEARAARGNAGDLRQELRTYILGNYGKAAVTMLEDFGMSPKTKSGPTVKTKAEAQVKAVATREARHTMGKKQKLAITGASAATQSTSTDHSATSITVASSTPITASIAPVSSNTPQK